ncbi:MAG: hypothetical protein GVY28_11845 [Alphaproteobacteria bacterium]|jgi:hypothetical protein|nr:hypothetical protein [Alphaproteobacteria bacterium]
MHREQFPRAEAGPADADNVIAFPGARARRPAAPVEEPPAVREAVDPDTLVLYAASAGSVSAESIIDMVRAGDPAPARADNDRGRGVDDESGPIDFGLLWGALLGIAARHGQMAALDALETLLDEVRDDPYHYLIEQRDRIDRARDLKSRTGNVLGALMVESHPGPYVTEAGE